MSEKIMWLFFLGAWKLTMAEQAAVLPKTQHKGNHEDFRFHNHNVQFTAALVVSKALSHLSLRFPSEGQVPEAGVNKMVLAPSLTKQHSHEADGNSTKRETHLKTGASLTGKEVQQAAIGCAF